MAFRSDQPRGVILGANDVPPDAAEARERVWDTFERLDRLDAEDLRRVSLPPYDHARLAQYQLEIMSAATASGREGMLLEAQEIAREVAMRRFGDALYRPTWLGLNWGLSMGPSDDRVQAALALELAVAAAVVEDLVDPDLVAELTEGLAAIEGVRRTGPGEGSAAAALSARSPWVRIVAIVILIAFAGQIALAVAAALGPLAAVGAAGVLVAVLVRIARSSGRSDPR
jgi:hypothetical protein